MSLPRIHIHVLGGTITMANAAGGGAKPSVDGQQLVDAIPALADLAQVHVDTPFLKPSASQTFVDIGMLAKRLNADHEAQGHVIVQGTDTIDETSFALNLLYGGDAPVVVTGAMRTASAVSGDGSGNILAAVQTALAPDLHCMGVVVTFNDTIHAADRVEKTHKGLLNAFTSPQGGALGYVLEGKAQLLNQPQRTYPHFQQADFAKVAIIKASLDADTDLLEASVSLGYQGVVVEATGAGHVSATWADALVKLNRQIPVVLASRVMGGPIFSHTYAFKGSEMDLLHQGLISAGWLSAHKARLLLALALGNHVARDEMAPYFAKPID